MINIRKNKTFLHAFIFHSRTSFDIIWEWNILTNPNLINLDLLSGSNSFLFQIDERSIDTENYKIIR